MPEQSGHAPTRYKAVLVFMGNVGDVSQDLKPFVDFKGTLERRRPEPKDVVAIFKVFGTSSHFVVFLDAGKTVEDIDREVEPYEVLIPKDARKRVAEALEVRALHLAATG